VNRSDPTEALMSFSFVEALGCTDAIVFDDSFAFLLHSVTTFWL
jgi:hypothetical protein